MRIPDQILAQIADRLDMGEVVSEYVRLDRKSGRLWGLCPFHPEKTASFTVNPDKGMFYCFGCHKGGSLFTFVMEIEKISFPEAVRLLAEKAGVELELEEGDTRDKEAYLELYRRVAGTFHYLLLHHPQAAGARAYLERRGVDRAQLERFQIGYTPPARGWLGQFLRDKQYSGEFLSSCGLFVSSRAAQSLVALFRDRIMFPIRNQRDEVVAFGGRSVRPEVEPKYLNSPETAFFRKGELLFGAPEVFRRIRREGRFVLVEGYMDVLAVERTGVEPAVAPLGTAATADQLRLLKRHAEKGGLLFDNDEAGRRAAERILVLAERMDLNLEVIELPRGKDPADIIEKQGIEALNNCLKCTITGFQFLLEGARARFDAGTPDGKRSVIRELSSFLTSIDSQVKRDGYLRLLAEELGVDFDSVRHDVLKEDRQAAVAVQPKQAGERIAPSSELLFLLAVAANRDYFPKIRGSIAVEDIEDGRARHLYIALEECFREGETSEEALLRRLQDHELRQTLLERIASGEFSIRPERVIRDGLRAVRVRSLERRRRSLSQELGRVTEGPRLRELLSEKMYLDEELQSLKVTVDDRPAE